MENDSYFVAHVVRIQKTVVKYYVVTPWRILSSHGLFMFVHALGYKYSIHIHALNKCIIIKKKSCFHSQIELIAYCYWF